MALSRTVVFEHQSSVDAVFALLSDASYLEQRCRMDGDRNISVRVHRDDTGVHQEIARDRTIPLPAFVRGLLKPTNYTTEIIHWQRTITGFEASYEVTAKTMPGTLRGSLELAYTPTGARYTAAFEVVARVPLVARKLEALMTDGFADYLQLNAERDDAALRGPLLQPVELAASVRFAGR
jgi:hypothetical protein